MLNTPANLRVDTIPSRPVLDVDFCFEPQRGTEYRVCTTCVMDTTDPKIEFDSEGVCSHCRRADRRMSELAKLRREGDQELQLLVEKIKCDGRQKTYDCIIGLSGGVDSSYLALLVRQLGLRPLAVHLDNGWNAEIAVKNIEQIVRLLDIDLHTHVINWQEFRDLQLSFLKAHVVDIELLTDHAIWAALYAQAVRHRSSWIILGDNHASESILPSTWVHRKEDASNIRSIQKQFGSIPIHTFPTCGFLKRTWYSSFHGIKVASLLNYIDYDKYEAMDALKKELGYRPYRGKHYESVFTRFYQAYILPRKFGIDKRRAHLSSLVVAGQLTREQASDELQQPLYRADELQREYEYVIKKWGLSVEDFEAYLSTPRREHREFGNDERIRPLGVGIAGIGRRLRRVTQAILRT